jgi:hypothetical protein
VGSFAAVSARGLANGNSKNKHTLATTVARMFIMVLSKRAPIVPLFAHEVPTIGDEMVSGKIEQAREYILGGDLSSD